MAYDQALLVKELTEDEGRKLALYSDKRGNLTIGIGHNMRNGITDAVCDLMLAGDIAAAEAALDRNLPWWRRLPDAPARTMVNLCFNMGWPTLTAFRRFLAAMELGDWETAADELRNSAWWHEVGERGPRVIARLLSTNKLGS